MSIGEDLLPEKTRLYNSVTRNGSDYEAISKELGMNKQTIISKLKAHKIYHHVYSSDRRIGLLNKPKTTQIFGNYLAVPGLTWDQIE